MTPAKARQLIRQIAATSNQVFFTRHAESRMRQRKIARNQVLRCLLHGVITEEPYQDLKTADWRCTLHHVTAGDRIGVGIAIHQDPQQGHIVVITAFHL